MKCRVFCLIFWYVKLKDINSASCHKYAPTESVQAVVVAAAAPVVAQCAAASPAATAAVATADHVTVSQHI